MISIDRKNLFSETGKLIFKHLKTENKVAHFEANSQAAEITIREITDEDFTASEIALHVYHETTISASGDSISLIVPLTNELVYSINGEGGLKLPHNHFNIIHSRDSKLQYHFRKGVYKFLSIKFSFSFLSKWSPYHILLRRFLTRIKTKNVVAISDQPIPITGRIAFLANELFVPARSFAELYRHTNVLDILRLACTQFASLRVFYVKQSVSQEKEHLKVEKVREYIAHHLNSKFSLTDLAELVSTNDFMLKRDFKKIHGKSIFAYWSEKKMLVAKYLLTDTDLFIREIGQIVGFHLQSNFTAAFKAHHKISPAAYRKRYQKRFKKLLKPYNG
jgi:AraC-like DNA-binding protein